MKVAYDLAIGGATIVSHLLRIRVDRQDGVVFAFIAQAPRQDQVVKPCHSAALVRQGLVLPRT